MNENIKRFGGELEFVNVEVKDSTYEARKEFFNILDWRKPQVFSELLDLFDLKSLPDKFQDNWKEIDYFADFLFRNIKEVNLIELEWSKTDIKPDTVKTPVIFYYNYLSGKKAELEISAEKVRADREKQGFEGINKYSKDDAIEDLIPDWKTIQQDEKANDLCASLIRWAEKYNIYEDWVMDFALIKLRKIKIIIDEKLQSLESDANNRFRFSAFDFDRCKSKASSEAGSAYLWGRAVDPFHFYMELDGYPMFEFNELGIALSDRWMPVYTTRQAFTERVEREFLRQSKPKLQVLYESSNDFNWFIKELQEIKSTSEKFKKSLKRYCMGILKIQPKNTVKTPVKTSGNKHFEWLVDFQINDPIEKTYEDIANENNTDSKNIRSGVESIGKLIGLKLRHAPKTGRPKGVKENRERANYSHW